MNVPPSIALARMLWRRSWRLAYGKHTVHQAETTEPWRRGEQMPFAERVYYRALDRINAGEAP